MTTNPCGCGKPLVIAESELATLKTLDTGNCFLPRFTDERIGTLQEAIDIAAQSGIRRSCPCFMKSADSGSKIPGTGGWLCGHCCHW
jgi:hypothetical protein